MSKVTMADALAAGDGVILNEQVARIKELEEQRDELIAALVWYAGIVEDLDGNGVLWTAENALGLLRADLGKRAKEAITKVIGENNE